jgi:Uma2 family endonuclease
MFAMAGASEEHNLITSNVTRELSLQLKGRPCRVYASDMRVKVSATGLYTYPDVVVVCGERRLEAASARPPDTASGHARRAPARDTLLNPTLLVEVLSPTTEAYDRGDKFAHYRRLESLQEYVLIAQERTRIERYVRQAEGKEWVLTEFSDLQDRVPLPSIGCELALEEVYDKVDLPPAADPMPLRPHPPS